MLAMREDKNAQMKKILTEEQYIFGLIPVYWKYRIQVRERLWMGNVYLNVFIREKRKKDLPD